MAKAKTVIGSKGSVTVGQRLIPGQEWLGISRRADWWMFRQALQRL
ncbi:MAG: hypothetical protein PHS52_00940 [Desulfotomaculaceae bacterium]|nr:hypothetical protein [Desulfotomaculaceae bacterium]